MSARLLLGGSVDDHSGLSVDDALARCASDSESVTLRLYTYQPCVLVGRFQHVEDEVNIEYCDELDIPINRRPTGGGSIIMGPDQLGIALVIPAENRFIGRSSTTLMSSCAKGILRALRDLGTSAEFRGKNDLVISGKKIAGLGVYQAPGGGILFHASLLLDLNIRYMLMVLKTAFENDSDKGFSAVSKRITTLHREVSADLSMSELTQAVRRGYEKEFSVQLQPGCLSDAERTMADKLCGNQYSSKKWIFQTASRIRDRVGHYQFRTDGGTLDVRAIVANNTVKSVFLTGNFIASENAISDLESSLRWHDCNTEELNRTIAKSHQKNRQFWNPISATDIAYAIQGAIDRSIIDSDHRAPNACFARAGAAS